jgi:hypothetical protein
VLEGIDTGCCFSEWLLIDPIPSRATVCHARGEDPLGSSSSRGWSRTNTASFGPLGCEPSTRCSTLVHRPNISLQPTACIASLGSYRFHVINTNPPRESPAGPNLRSSCKLVVNLNRCSSNEELLNILWKLPSRWGPWVGLVNVTPPRHFRPSAAMSSLMVTEGTTQADAPSGFEGLGTVSRTAGSHIVGRAMSRC